MTDVALRHRTHVGFVDGAFDAEIPQRHQRDIRGVGTVGVAVAGTDRFHHPVNRGQHHRFLLALFLFFHFQLFDLQVVLRLADGGFHVLDFLGQRQLFFGGRCLIQLLLQRFKLALIGGNGVLQLLGFDLAFSSAISDSCESYSKSFSPFWMVSPV